MPVLFIYLLKLSVSLGVVFLFYQLVLRRLTFYNCNRWYLLGYTMLSFIIPFIDISPALDQHELADSTLVQWIPILYNQSGNGFVLSGWNIVSLVMITGMLLLAVRLVIQVISFRKMMRKAELISGDGIQLYQVNDAIIPFSFGNAVFINPHQHTAAELEKIIRHEFVHVKQRHSIDILLGEFLCLLNWYNPFAWLLRSAIRQNLEFVADHQVLENGVDKKQYQYLLLKVTGNNQFSIAPKFNFSSLKKRIAMMNKSKSAKMNLLRFLFLLPVIGFILVSFRKEIGDRITGQQKPLKTLTPPATDTIPEVTEQNSKGYIINVKDNKGECLLVIKDKTGKEIKRLLLTEWNTAASTYEAIYGEIPPPPPPKPARLEGFPVPPATPGAAAVVEGFPISPAAPTATVAEGYRKPPPAPVVLEEVVVQGFPLQPSVPTPPNLVELPAHVQKINLHNNKATVWLKNGTTESYDLAVPAQKESFEKKYGKIIVEAPAVPAKPVKGKPLQEVTVELIQKEVPVDASLTGPGNPHSPAINIRSSFTKGISANVIYIIDGAKACREEVNNLDPDKIESIHVLKGSSATALYGSSASEGVILINTKSGSEVNKKKNYITRAAATKLDNK